jgi:hypothetical protein
MMRKILGFLAVLVIVAVVAWNMNFGSKTDDVFSDIAMANVEALANENGQGERIKYCRQVNCSGTWEGNTNLEGCIPLPGGIKICGFTANVHVSFTYFGKKENCTGGNEWYDCDECQDYCVPDNY